MADQRHCAGGRLRACSGLHGCHASTPCLRRARCAGCARDASSCPRQPIYLVVYNPLGYHAPIPSTRPGMKAVGRTKRRLYCNSIANLLREICEKIAVGVMCMTPEMFGGCLWSVREGDTGYPYPEMPYPGLLHVPRALCSS
jgi:hypothetical protein